jgi:hypothetical protein
MNLKNEYEFATNFDFDEFIFPRFKETNDFTSFNGLNCTNLEIEQQNQTYNIYDYAVRLKTKLGQNTACFKFNHVVFLKETQQFLEKLRSFKKSDTVLRFQMGDTFVDYSINNNDESFISDINKFRDLVDCLNRSLVSNNVFSEKWDIPYATVMNMREGKSLYDTTLTYAINQHGASATDKSSCADVPIRLGYVSHFRDHVKGFFVNQKYPFSFFQFDLEYLLFIYFSKRS